MGLGVNKIIGISKTISISKTRKITAKRKKRREKGIRAVEEGSNPHSKGEIFSRSFSLRREDRKVTVNKRRGIKIAIRRNILAEYT